MKIVKAIDEVQEACQQTSNLTWGFVPTMGALHEGHLSLVRKARADCDRVAVSIYVNPMQFNNADDLDAYPRNLESDAVLLEAEGVDLIWAPDNSIMYPEGFQTEVSVTKLTRPLEGSHRPGHFTGVTTIVAKLFNVIQPDRAYFGQKDAQQVAVIKRMVKDLNMPIQVIIGAIVREADGLAMSSRNARLNPAERKAALVLYRALQAAETAWEGGNNDPSYLRTLMMQHIAREPLARADYVSVADPDTLMELDDAPDRALLSMAVFVGDIRLIDNVVVW